MALCRGSAALLLPGMAASEASVQVVVRLRPLNAREQKNNTTPIVTASTERSEVTVIKGSGKAQVRNTFKFANVFGSFTTQEDIFKETLEPGANNRRSSRLLYLRHRCLRHLCLRPPLLAARRWALTLAEPCAVIDDVMGGFESTVFAYGQTGTGKTHTMEGDIHNEEQWGVIPRAASTIFKRLAKDTIVESSVTVSYLEIYNEELCDLLAQEGEETKLMVAEDKSKGGKGVHCHGLSEVHVAAPEDVLQKLQEAQDRRI
eukprot:COSAG02_NODE_14501_length_1265_cov_2.277015_1_plen_259_part_10